MTRLMEGDGTFILRTLQRLQLMGVLCRRASLVRRHSKSRRVACLVSWLDGGKLPS
jgi:hypothetical protein